MKMTQPLLYFEINGSFLGQLTKQAVSIVRTCEKFTYLINR